MPTTTTAPVLDDKIEAFKAEDMDVLKDKGVLGNFERARLNDALDKAGKELDPAKKFETMAEVWGTVKQSLAYDLGIGEKPDLNLKGAVSYGMDKIDDYLKL